MSSIFRSLHSIYLQSFLFLICHIWFIICLCEGVKTRGLQYDDDDNDDDGGLYFLYVRGLKPGVLVTIDLE